MSKIKAGIVTFLGTNCERDTKYALESLGWTAEYIWQDDIINKQYDVIFLPGGFSYGDHISSGRIAKLSNAVKSLPVGKTMIVGICNGFQILCESKLLSGVLTHNENMKFISKVVSLDFFCETIKIPIAHHQGNFTYSQKNGLKTDEKIIMKYKENVNGSDDNIAGIYNIKEKIIGIMPHPERAVFKELGLTDGKKIFEFIKNEI